MVNNHWTSSLRMWPPIALSLIAIALLAGRSAADEADVAEPTTLVRGVVVDGGAPASGVRVFCDWIDRRGEQRAESVTGADGKFELAIPTKSLGGRLIRAEATDRQRQAVVQLPWERNQAAESDLQLEMKKARRIELHVVDREGRPLESATTGVANEYNPLDSNNTDEAGRAVFFLPQDVSIDFVYAIKNGHGAHYRAYVLPYGQRGDRKATPPKLPDGPIVLTLEGTSPVRVRVVEPDGAPIAGLEVYPWILQKPDEPVSLNLSFFSDVVISETNEQGVATFDWWPTWHVSQVLFWPKSEEYSRQRGVYDPKSGAGELEMTLDRLVPIRGRVTLPDGAPAAGVQIQACGDGHQFDDFRTETVTDAEGRYELMAAPNMIYLLTAKKDRLAAAARTGFAVWPGKPIEDLDFELRPATRLFGRVTIGAERLPAQGQQVTVYQYGKSTLELPDIELPNPELSRTSVRPTTFHHATTDMGGAFEILVGDGAFDIRSPDQTQVERFEIAGEADKEFNFHAMRREKGLLSGRVVAGEPAVPVAKAQITGIYQSPLGGRDLEAETDDAGRFEVERDPHAMVLHARSEDGKLAGIARITAEDNVAEIVLRPLASARGRLLDGDSGKPLAGQELVFGVNVPSGGEKFTTFRRSFGGSTATDETGHFTIDALILREEFSISATIRTGEGPSDISWRRISVVTPEKAELIELGDLKLAAPERPPTPAERAAKAFASKREMPLAERLNELMIEARREYTRPLLLFGKPDDPACAELFRLFQEAAPEGAEFLSPGEWRWEYELAVLDDGRTDVEELAAKLKIDVTGSELVLALLNDDGSLVETLKLEMKDEKLDARRIGEWMDKHKLARRDAQKMLDDALDQAKKEDKRVFFMLSASWCGPCRMLARFLAPHKEELEKHYVFVKLDVSRDENADSLQERFKESAGGGVPWFCIVDGDAKVLTTSNLPAEIEEYGTSNIGFPSRPADVEHFLEMLKSTAPSLSAEELAKYKAELLETK